MDTERAQMIAYRWHRTNFEQRGDAIVYCQGLHSGDECEYDTFTLADLEQLLSVDVLAELLRLKQGSITK